MHVKIESKPHLIMIMIATLSTMLVSPYISNLLTAWLEWNKEAAREEEKKCVRHETATGMRRSTTIYYLFHVIQFCYLIKHTWVFRALVDAVQYSTPFWPVAHKTDTQTRARGWTCIARIAAAAVTGKSERSSKMLSIAFGTQWDMFTMYMSRFDAVGCFFSV